VISVRDLQSHAEELHWIATCGSLGVAGPDPVFLEHWIKAKSKRGAVVASSGPDWRR
jgi:hypothetical protein